MTGLATEAWQWQEARQKADEGSIMVDVCGMSTRIPMEMGVNCGQISGNESQR